MVMIRKKKMSICTPKSTVCVVALMLLCSIFKTTRACPNHDLETVYGSYKLSYPVDSFLFAVDTSTFDLAAAGTATVASEKKHFIYYFEDRSCSVKWHYFLDTSDVSSFKELSIRPESNRIYGIVTRSSSSQHRLFELRTDLSESEALTIRYYSVSFETFGLLAPPESAYIYILGEQGMMQVYITETSTSSSLQVDLTGALSMDMAYTSDNAMHVLQQDGTRLYIKKFSLDNFTTPMSLQSQMQLELSNTPVSFNGASYISVYKPVSGAQLTSVCSHFQIDNNGDYQINIFATKTIADNPVISEARLATGEDYLACEATNAASDDYTYTLLRKNSSQGLVLIKIDAATSGTYTLTNQQSVQKVYLTDEPRKVTFLDQSSNADQFLLGGVYKLPSDKTVGLVLTAVESRRSSSNDMWDSPSTIGYSSFGTVSTFSSGISSIRSSISQPTSSLSLVKTVTPTDYHEYSNAIFEDESGDGEAVDVEPAQSIQFNLRPENKTALHTSTIYATFGKSIAQSLVKIEDKENQPMYTVVHNTGNVRLPMWVNGAHTYLFSEQLREQENAEIGSSTVTITYIDSVTTAEFNVTYTLEVISRDTYARYQTLGIIGPDSIIETQTSTASSSSSEIDYFAMLEAMGITQEEYEAFEEQQSEQGIDIFSGGELNLGAIEQIDFGEVEGIEDVDFDSLLDQFGDELGFTDTDTQNGAPSGTSTQKGGLDCVFVVQEEEVAFEGDIFRQFGSVDDMIEKRLEDYDTEENWLKLYGGRVEFPEPQLSKTGNLKIAFSRSLIFPTELIAEQNKEYAPVVPELKLPEEEMAKVREEYEEYTKALEDVPLTTTRYKTVQVCTEIAGSSDSKSTTGGSSSSTDEYDEDDEKKDDDDDDDYEDEDQGDDEDQEYDDDKLRRLLSRYSQGYRNDYDPSKSLRDRFKISVISEQKLDEETEEEVQQYTWTIVSVDSSHIEFKIDFKFPFAISTDRKNPHYLQVQAQFSDFEPGWIDDRVLINLKLPKQEKELTEEQVAMAEQAQAIADTGSNSIVSTIIFNILTSGAMSQIWGMINSMQIFAHLPVFQIDVPTYSKSTIDSILEISSFEIIPISWMLEQALIPPDGDGDEALKSALAIEYESYYMVNNLGTIFVIFVWLLSAPPLILLLLRPCESKSRFVGKNATSLRSSLRGKMQMRFLIEGSLDISLCVAFQFYYSDLNHGLNFNSVFMGINTVITVFFAIALSILLPLVFIFYFRMRKKWMDKTFNGRYGEIFVGLRKDRVSSLYYPMNLFIRRFLFTMVAILAIEHVFAQIWVMYLTCFIQMIYLIIVRPFENPTMQKLEVYNEICSIFLLYSLMAFTGANMSLAQQSQETGAAPSPWDGQLEYDWIFFSILGLNVLVHILLLFKSSVVALKNTIVAKCCKKKPAQLKQAINPADGDSKKPDQLIQLKTVASSAGGQRKVKKAAKKHAIDQSDSNSKLSDLINLKEKPSLNKEKSLILGLNLSQVAEDNEEDLSESYESARKSKRGVGSDKEYGSLKNGKTQLIISQVVDEQGIDMSENDGRPLTIQSEHRSQVDEEEKQRRVGNMGLQRLNTSSISLDLFLQEMEQVLDDPQSASTTDVKRSNQGRLSNRTEAEPLKKVIE